MANPKKIQASVKEIIPFGGQVYKLVFKVNKKLPKFKAGQFLHLTLDHFDPTTGFWPESRVFSIASCSSDRMEVAIVYSVKGVYTQKMEDRLCVGSSVWIKAPYGEFIIPNHVDDGETAVLIAGGTGVSPFIPFLEDVPETIHVKLNYGLRDVNLMIFNQELAIVAGNQNFELNLFLEKPVEGLPLNGNVSVKDGMLAIDTILSDLDDVSQSKFFLSGPPAMIELFKQQLVDSDVSDEKIIIDEWG